MTDTSNESNAVAAALEGLDPDAVSAAYERAAGVRPDLQPLGDRVLVRPDTPEAVTTGGIIIPEVAQTKGNRGTVIAVGPGHRHINDEGLAFIGLEVQPGDRVLYPPYGGVEVDDHIILREDELIAKER